MATQRNQGNLHSSSVNAPSSLDPHQACTLQKRWQTIRLQEIQRQLRVFTGFDFAICVDKPFDGCEKIIFFPEHALALPCEVVASIAAHLWYQRMQLPSLSASFPNTDFITTYPFIASFLKRYHYSIKKVLLYFVGNSKEQLKEVGGLSNQICSLVLAYHQAQQKTVDCQNPLLHSDNHPSMGQHACPLLKGGMNPFKRRILKHPDLHNGYL